jgi:integrase
MAEGIEVRHGRTCPAPTGGRCRCKPSYRAKVYLPGDGRRRTATFATLGEARRWRTALLRDVHDGRISAPSTTTVRQAAEALLADMAAGMARTRSGDEYKPSVIRSYGGCLRRYILPELGGAKLDQVRRGDVQRLADRLATQGMDASTIRNALMPLRVIYRRAIRTGAVAVSPCEELELPAVRGRRERIATPAEAAAMLAALAGIDRAIWALAFYAGLRLGELRALSASDVDLAAGVIRIRHQLDERNNRVAPKSRAGVRDVPVIGPLRTLLATTTLGTGSHALSLRGGRPFSAARLATRSEAAWAAKGLEPITLHEARHTFASILIASGLDAKQVATYMGHSSVQVTFDVYGKLFPQSRQEAIRRVDEYLTGPQTFPQEA